MGDIFCTKYAAWRERGEIIYENDHAYAMLSATPAVPGHSIVITKRHAERMEDLRGDELEAFVDAFGQTAEAVRTLYRDDFAKIASFYRSLKEEDGAPMFRHPDLSVPPIAAYNVGMNVGAEAGQSVPHLHAQIFPRREPGLGIATMVKGFLGAR